MSAWRRARPREAWRGVAHGVAHGVASCTCVQTCIYSSFARLGDHAKRYLRAPCSNAMVLGAEYSDPASKHGPNPSADIPWRPKQPQRPAQKPLGSSWRCHRIRREELACIGARFGAEFRGISRAPWGLLGWSLWLFGTPWDVC